MTRVAFASCPTFQNDLEMSHDNLIFVQYTTKKIYLSLGYFLLTG